MKQILVISDIHGESGNLAEVLKLEKYSDVIFCGDGITEMLRASVSEGARKFYVLGNADRHYSGSIGYDLTAGIHGKLFFITHGDEYGVKGGTGSLISYCSENYIDVCIFGHTHGEYLSEKDGIVLFNPGALVSGRYGIIDCGGSRLKFIHKKI